MRLLAQTQQNSFIKLDDNEYDYDEESKRRESKPWKFTFRPAVVEAVRFYRLTRDS